MLHVYDYNNYFLSSIIHTQNETHQNYRTKCDCSGGHVSGEYGCVCLVWEGNIPNKYQLTFVLKYQFVSSFDKSRVNAILFMVISVSKKGYPENKSMRGKKLTKDKTNRKQMGIWQVEPQYQQ